MSAGSDAAIPYHRMFGNCYCVLLYVCLKRRSEPDSRPVVRPTQSVATTTIKVAGTMATPGYRPTRDEMNVIVETARLLLKVVRRWQKYSLLPGFPVERGNQSALSALFALERALNPRRLAWGHKDRKQPVVRNWGNNVADSVAWLRALLDILMEKNRLESMTIALDFESWSARSDPLPQTVSVSENELRALRIAVSWLPNLDVLSPPVSPPVTLASRPVPRDSPPAEDGAIPVQLFGVRLRPFVLGRFKDKLTPAQFRVVEALINAGGSGLSKAGLMAVSGDAINVLKRLAKSDDDWGAVIHLPGRPGLGYRIGASADQRPPTPSHTDPSTLSHTTPHSSKSV